MSEPLYDAILAIDDEFEPKITVPEAEQLKPIQKKFIASYIANRDKMPVDQWLRLEMADSLPERSATEIENMSDGIITTLNVQEEKKASLEKAIQSGRSKESWFASEAKRAASYMSAREASKYLHNLDNALESVNESFSRTIHTQAGAGAVSRNPNLDGFIAEQYHAQTFNLNAEVTGRQYRAKVLEPTGTGYTKNSVDIVVVDGNGKTVGRYQSKYCKDADATAQAFEQGDYRGQQKLVPEGQGADIAKKTTTVLEAPDGTTSNPLTKVRAKELQIEAQSGKWNDLNWNEYQVRDLAEGIGKQAGQAALMGAAIGAGFYVAQKVWNGEEIDGAEVVETAIVSGADFGIKVAAAGALKVGVEKGIISAIPKGTHIDIITSVVYVAVENIKVIHKMATGEFTLKEGLEKMEQVTVSTVAGINAIGKAAVIGAKAGSVFGPVGVAVGGYIGGTIGYMAGSKVGEIIVICKQRIREKAWDVVETVGRTIKKKASSVASDIRNSCSGVRGSFSW